MYDARDSGSNRKSRLRGFRNCALDGLVRADGCGLRAISDRGGAGCVVLGRLGQPYSARGGPGSVGEQAHPSGVFIWTSAPDNGSTHDNVHELAQPASVDAHRARYSDMFAY